MSKYILAATILKAEEPDLNGNMFSSDALRRVAREHSNLSFDESRKVLFYHASSTDYQQRNTGLQNITGDVPDS